MRAFVRGRSTVAGLADDGGGDGGHSHAQSCLCPLGSVTSISCSHAHTTDPSRSKPGGRERRGSRSSTGRPRHAPEVREMGVPRQEGCSAAGEMLRETRRRLANCCKLPEARRRSIAPGWSWNWELTRLLEDATGCSMTTSWLDGVEGERRRCAVARGEVEL